MKIDRFAVVRRGMEDCIDPGRLRAARGGVGWEASPRWKHRRLGAVTIAVAAEMFRDDARKERGARREVVNEIIWNRAMSSVGKEWLDAGDERKTGLHVELVAITATGSKQHQLIGNRGTFGAAVLSRVKFAQFDSRTSAPSMTLADAT
jgi:hypothetical protein